MTFTKQITCNICLILLFSGSVYAQSSIEDERKKSLLNQVKPPLQIIDPNMRNYKEQFREGAIVKVVNKDNIHEKIGQYRNGGAQFEDKLTTKGLGGSMANMDLFKMENGSTYKVVISNGKSYFIKKSATDFIQDNLSQKNRLQDIKAEVTAGGLNLSGFKEKKPISTKSKNVLKHVLGMDIDD